VSCPSGRWSLGVREVATPANVCEACAGEFRDILIISPGGTWTGADYSAPSSFLLRMGGQRGRLGRGERVVSTHFKLPIACPSLVSDHLRTRFAVVNVVANLDHARRSEVVGSCGLDTFCAPKATKNFYRSNRCGVHVVLIV
jgi:hypothetical protein